MAKFVKTVCFRLTEAQRRAAERYVSKHSDRTGINSVTNFARHCLLRAIASELDSASRPKRTADAGDAGPRPNAGTF